MDLWSSVAIGVTEPGGTWLLSDLDVSSGRRVEDPEAFSLQVFLLPGCPVVRERAVPASGTPGSAPETHSPGSHQGAVSREASSFTVVCFLFKTSFKFILKSDIQ